MKKCRKLIMVFIIAVSAFFLYSACDRSFLYADDDGAEYKKVEGSGDEAVETDIPASGKIEIDKGEPETPIDPENPDGGARKPEPDEPVAEIPAEPDKVVTSINRGFASISSIDTGDRQQWDYYKKIFLISGSILVILSLSQIFKRQQKTI